MKDNAQNSKSKPTLTPPVLSSLLIISKDTKQGNFACSKSSAGNPGNQARSLLSLTIYDDDFVTLDLETKQDH